MAALVSLAGMSPFRFLKTEDRVERDNMAAIAEAADEIARRRLDYLVVQIGKLFGGR